MDESEQKPSSNGAVRAFMSLLSSTGPEVPPDVTDGSTKPPPPSNAVDEPTAPLPVIAPRFTARAVIVYEPEPRRSRGLLVFTALLVALTVGVVLGQSVAYQPVSGSASTRPIDQAPPTQPVPGSAAPVTAPLGQTRTRSLEVTGASALLRIRSADLGDLLFSVATPDGGPMPTVVDISAGPLTLAQTAQAGRTEVQISSKVRWTIRLAGQSATQDIDMSAGGLAGIELVGGASQAVLALPRPAGAVALRVTGAVSELHIRAGGGPVRLRLGSGADTATLAGREHRNVRAGTALLSPGWRSAKNRYDVLASAKVGTVLVDQGP
ncbi:MAG TPA: hypothetical protein VFT95_00710 [Micromonosporaceae bacterium]|nr:hypothetical protein [Micromonosporaceae bacterium]